MSVEVIGDKHKAQHITAEDDRLIQFVAEEIDPGAWSHPYPCKRKELSLRQARRAVNAVREFQQE